MLADALLERGDPAGEMLAVLAAAGFRVTFLTNTEVETQRLISASHPPTDLLRMPNSRWVKRAYHLPHCDLRASGVDVCRCPMREPPLYRRYRSINGGLWQNGEWIPGAWTFDIIYSHVERDREELRFDWADT